MHRNYFTLYHAAMELNVRLAGGFVFEIHSQQKNELILGFVTASGEHLQVVMVLRVPELCLFTREGMCRRKRQSASLLQCICEREVTGVAMSPYDREIVIGLSGGDELVLRLFSASINAFFVKDGVIADACISANTLIGKPYHERTDCSAPGIVRELELLTQDKKRFSTRIMCAERTDGETTSISLPGFDRGMLRTLAERTGEQCSPDDLFEAFSDMFYELLDPQPQTGRTPEGKPLFSILHNPLMESFDCSSVLDGLNRYSTAMWSWLHTSEGQGELETKLRQQLRKIEKELQDYDPGMLAEKADEYETYGHLLMGALYLDRIEPERITVPDIFNPGAPDIAIRLKPELPVSENAADYFRKAAKTRGKCTAMAQRKVELEARKILLDSLLTELASLVSPKAVKRFIETHRAELQKTGLASVKASTGHADRFRIVKLSPSATLYIGKNAKNNEQLTFAFAKPNDIWLHARGCSGSHCVLRGVSLQQKEEIRKAAEYAARHSAAKHSELVPVMYTLKKHVRRSKHLPPGQVKLDREEVILVSPAKHDT
ncbi:MAG: NFACT RNA binding domain-containing protein [Chlorobium sp.]|jgi:predicted ribosome quality control (RQC) complex YloA/Tae2 family protein|uniref:NFACT RNA binding domain-containing protein n=1 Tax=Chlorobium sp. TaxID=1095 RepID=UPI0025C49174|nr:NFACT RNA binding domain-containing protein [Chlorobium sp.]MCF8216408.1 NFACT RNA binding domain-containing protein [Chlorobium sp.]MCF8271311.1 NFACT RNA binding domain-containing protein [Chlorobium sp.]MCF8287685.1 NFACT RNA binding domain-containing protein [Chlorobium sp.]MCF8291224.1 NFACT RNA binding domain-containing protein [Chlorobium sp.]MCF8385354.1 NFACT RNA binding domain-containing protein [Chlorobium sp.]